MGVEVLDIDCARPEPGEVEQIRRALHEHELLVFRDQGHLTPRQEVSFYRAVDTHATTVWRDQTNNPWELFKVEQGNQAGTHQIPDEPGVLVLGEGRIDHHGLKVTLGGGRAAYGDSGSQVLGGGSLQWHIDGAFYTHDPCLYTQMRCVEAPASQGHWAHYEDGTGAKIWCESGSTAFVSGRTAFGKLSERDQLRASNMRVHYQSHPFRAAYHLANSSNGLRVVDTAAEEAYSRGEDLPGEPVADPYAKVYPLVWTCPTVGEKALMAHPRCVHHVEETQADGEIAFGLVESRMILERLMRPGIEPGNVYVHAWEPGDLVIWHNHSMWHTATGGLAATDRRIQHLTAYDGAQP